MTKNKWAFFGTDQFSIFVLQSLEKAGWLPDLIVTVPDKPQGRKMVLTPPPVKLWAEEKNIPVVQPKHLKEPLDFEKENWDFFVVASYGRIIPSRIIDLPKFKTLNVHPSLLPLYRGASPIQSAILAGNEITGLTIMLVDEEMDHGPILNQAVVEMNEKSYLELENELGELGGQLLANILPDWLAGNIDAQEQDHKQATYTKKITKADAELDLKKPAEENLRKIRALNPDPSTFFFVKKDGKQIRIKVKSAHIENSELIPDLIIPEGKKEMKWADFKRNL